MVVLEIISSLCKVVMFLITCYVFLLGFNIKHNEKLIIPFWLLSFFSLLDSIIYIYFIIILRDINTYLSIIKWTQLCYILFEFFIIAIFLFEINNIKNVKIFKLLIIFIYIIILLVTIRNNWDFKEKYYTLITLIELTFINSLGIRYLLIISPDNLDQKSKKISILVRGIFLFINISSPYYIIIQFILREPTSILSSLSFINDIAYTVFFFHLIKSIKCK
jgi:hypothetical protein